jgi:hypothetical protein
VTTYALFGQYLRKFAEGELGLLLVLGRPGTGKTFHARAAVEGAPAATSESAEALYVEGHVQPFGLYQKLWEFRDRPVVLDDVDRLYADAGCVRLLKPLCGAAKTKRLSWLSNATRDRAALPDAFTTTSNVALVANDWRTCNANVRALEDRAIIIAFDPPNEEVHRKAGEWFTDGEVYEFVARWLAWIPTLSLRFYEKGGRLRGAGFSDWRESLLQMMLPDVHMAAVAALQCDASLRTEDQRVACFVARTGRSRATYFRLKRKLTPAALVG